MLRPLCLCFQISHPGPKPCLRSWLSLSYSLAPDINALFLRHLSHLCPSLYSCCLGQKQVPLSPPAPRAYTPWAPIRGPCLPCSTASNNWKVLPAFPTPTTLDLLIQFSLLKHGSYPTSSPCSTFIRLTLAHPLRLSLGIAPSRKLN